MRVLAFLLLVIYAVNSPASERMWSISDNEPHPKSVQGFPIDYNFEVEFMIPTIAMRSVMYGDRRGITLLINEWFGIKPEPKCEGTQINTPLDKGMGLYKFNDTWVKMIQVCLAYEREGATGIVDYYMNLAPETYEDAVKIINTFKKSNEVIYENKIIFSAKGFTNTFDTYKHRLGL